MIVIGLDLSINSTGICVNDDGEYTYYIITPHMTKKQKAISGTVLTYVEYQKGDSDEINMMKIGRAIEEMIKKHNPDLIVLEGVAMGCHSRSIVTLSQLNGYIRCICDYLDVNYIAVPPTQWKKQMIGNGQASKDVITHCFEGLQPQFKGLRVKVDDVADSYFLSNYAKGLNPYNHL